MNVFLSGTGRALPYGMATKQTRVAWYTLDELKTLAPELATAWVKLEGYDPHHDEGLGFFRALGGGWWCEHPDLAEVWRWVPRVAAWGSVDGLPLEAIDLDAALAWVKLTSEEASFEGMAVEFEDLGNDRVAAYVEYFDPATVQFTWDGSKWQLPPELKS